MDGPKFEFYVLNENFNKKEVEMWNIFNNINVYRWTLKEVKKYLRQGKKYKKTDMHSKETLYGFEAFAAELNSIIMWQEWARCGYEFAATFKFNPEITDIDLDQFDNLDDLKAEIAQMQKHTVKLKAFDCYDQASRNINTIAREVIYQYKQWKKQGLRELESEGILTHE